MSDKHYDLKVGFACNNKCKHCVIETNREHLLENKLKTDFSYGEIVKIINSEDFKSSNSITITGGEPTIRKDFERIIKYIGKNSKGKIITLQTNGRLLGKYIEMIEENIENMYYVVAIHSIDKNVHNNIVGVEYTGANSYDETFETLKKMVDFFGKEKIKNKMRIEIVLSKFNISTLVDTVKFLGNMGIRDIGISYPHADGFFNKYGIEGVKSFSLSYEDCKPAIYELYQYLESNKDVTVIFEEVPYCMIRDNLGKLLPSLSNLKSMSTIPSEVNIHFPSSEKVYFNDIWKNMHKHSSKCKDCCLKNTCLGVWFEAIDTFKDSGFVPIKDDELKAIGGIENVLNYFR